MISQTDLLALNNYCTIDLIEPEEYVIEGIYIPDSAKKESRWANVISVGPGVLDLNGVIRKPITQVGDVAYCMHHGINEIDLKSLGAEKNIHVISDLDVMAILKENFTIQPLGDFIEIEKIEPTTNEYGIELPDSRKFPPNFGKVISVGLGWTDFTGNCQPLGVEVGDIVGFDPFKTMVIDMSPLGKDERKVLIQVGDILVKVKNEKGRELSS